MADEYDIIGPVNAFGEELRAWRLQRGIRMADLTDALHLSIAMIGAMERGSRAATRTTAKLCDEVFNAPGTFERLWERQAKHAVRAETSPYYDLEAEAVRIHKWELRCMPGLLQTEDYARAIMQTGWPRGTDELIEDDVRARIERQRVLTADRASLAWFVIDESLLYRPYGDSRAQLEHLTGIAMRPNIVIQIMPFTAVEHPGHRGPITILEFSDSPPMAYAEGWGSGRLIESPADISKVVACYDLIRAAALSQTASLELIKRTGGSE